MMQGPELDSHFRVDHSLMWALTLVKHPQRTYYTPDVDIVIG
jgi:hypothetical protein